MRCRLGWHSWGIMRSYRLNRADDVFRVCCSRCGKRQSIAIRRG